MTPLSRRFLGVALVLLSATPLAAQHSDQPPEEPNRLTFGFGAQAIGLVTHARPAVFGRNLTEGYLTQPALMGHVGLADRLILNGMVNFEGLTLRRGELNTGIWGEGYVDRRHPHTYLHEVMATLRLVGRADAPRHATASFGKGFVPFGTDDPMSRPLVRYPANHHLAQVLERLVAVAAYREGPIVLEAALFNGDEPADPGDFASLSRFADSWALRMTVLPRRGIEATVSAAGLASPEFPAGSGLDHRKWSAALRYEVELEAGNRRYALLEWARTDEYSGDQRSFSFQSALAEGAVARGWTEFGVRLERTVRPEEERLLDPFRSPRPHGDANILGITRWWIVSARLAHRLAGPRSLALEPFAEASWLTAAATMHPSVMLPAEFYGSDRLWNLSAGLRIRAGSIHPRMGRYGAAQGTVRQITRQREDAVDPHQPAAPLHH